MSIDKFEELNIKISRNLTKYSVPALKCSEYLRLPLTWTAKYMAENNQNSCEILLKGSYGAAVESVSLIAFGLVRPAILSLRSYYELSLQHLYYKDHPIEWRSVFTYRAQPNLPGVNKKYLKDNFKCFEDRYKNLLSVKSRENEDCYQILSGIAHSTALNSISTATEPSHLIEKIEIVEQSVQIFAELAENLNDIFVASYEGNWLSLPARTKVNLEARYGEKNAREQLDF